MESIEAEIKRRLEILEPEAVEVVNDSARHAGHASSPNSGQSHFSLYIKSARFEGLSRVQRQRLVLDSIGDLFAQGLHALSIRAES